MKTTTSKIDGTVSSPSASLADRPKLPSATRYISLILLVLFLLSVIWTSFLGVLNYVPNATANYLMNTSSFDDGDFWQLSDPSPLHARAAFTGITLNGFGYVYLVLLVTRLATTTASGSASNPRPTFSTRLFRLGHKRARRRLPVPGQRVLAEMRAFYYELVSHDGKHRKNLLFEIIEVVIQTITLHELLSDGLHQSLIILYVSLMVINCVCCFYHITCAWKQHAYDELVTDAMLDIVFAVVFPAVVLVQAVRAYRTDLRAMQIRQKFFPAQPYGRRARIYSDPGQINSFTAAFDNLRITSPLDVVAKIGFNLLTCLRWRRIALTLRAKRRKDNTGAQNAPNKGKNHGIGPVIPNLSPCKDNLEAQVSYRPVPSYVGILFLLYGALAATYTYGALSMSNLACAPYATTCVLYAYQWSPSGEASLCPCLVFIERDMSPSIRTWLSLPDVSQNLSLLAAAGMLRTVQVMNRGMNYALPKHLMQCSDIRHLILINTDVEELPEWMVYAFPKLEYLHIEGQPRGNCITSLPDKLFSGMPALRTLSLSRHRVFTVPPFDGLVSLRTMYLGDVPFIPELPPLEPLHHLQTLGLVQIRNLAYTCQNSPRSHQRFDLCTFNTPRCVAVAF